MRAIGYILITSALIVLAIILVVPDLEVAIKNTETQEQILQIKKETPSAEAGDSEEKMMNPVWFRFDSGSHCIDFRETHQRFMEDWIEYLEIGSPRFSKFYMNKVKRYYVVDWSKVENITAYSIEYQQKHIPLEE